MRISWTEKLTNDAVLLKADTHRSLLKVITSRQIRFLGRVLRKNELEAIVLTEGKRARGRQRKMFLDWVSFACRNQWSGVEILKLCQRREEHQLIANVRF